MCCSQCVALSPDASSLAVGDVSGRISIWNNCLRAVIAAADSQQQQDDTVLSHPNVVHWHAKAVCALAFSLDSLSLLSGGHEAVLVRPDVLLVSPLSLPSPNLLHLVSRYTLRQTEETATSCARLFLCR